MRRWAPWLIALAALVFLYLIRTILPPFVIAIILAYVLVPPLDAISERFHIRRVLVVMLFYASVLLLLGAFLWWLRPMLMGELNGMRRDTAAVVERAFVRLAGGEEVTVLGTPVMARDVARAIVEQARGLFNSPTSAFELARRLVQDLAEVLLVFIALFYLLLDWQALVAFIFRFIPAVARPRAKVLAQSIHRILGRYLRGQLILVLLVSAITWLALRFLFRIPFSLPIAVATGFLEIIPLVGPIVAAGLASISALSVGGVNLALAVIAFYTLLRQLEDQLIAPNVLGRAVNVHPLAAIFAVLAGGTLAGPLGLILGVPAAAAIKIILDAVQAPVSPEQLPTVGQVRTTDTAALSTGEQKTEIDVNES